jgi:microcystin-dependent protein
MVITGGAEMVASDMTNLTMLPKGTILMFDGGSWVDNQTMSGWYKCNGQKINGKQTPDLVDRFIRGATSSGLTGGSTAGQKITLTAANIPSHAHGIIDAKHSHTVSLHGRHGRKSAADSPAWDSGDVFHSTASKTLDAHKSGLANQTNGTGKSNPASFEVISMPNYYTVIYIIKMV